MQFTVRPNDDGFVLTIDGAEHAVTAADLKAILLEITRTLMPDEGANAAAASGAAQFIRRLKTANDVGIQALLLHVDEDDILVLLKLGENDKDFLDKVYGNMSDRSRKIFVEDLNFRFRHGVPDSLVAKSMGNLEAAVEDLRNNGTEIFS